MHDSMTGFGFADALGTTGILERCEERCTQCATGTPARHAFDELDLVLRRQSEAQSVSLVPSTTLPPMSIAATSRPGKNVRQHASTSASSCCSSRTPAKRVDLSSVVCDVDASIARTIFYDFARQDNHPRIEIHPSSLEWSSFFDIPGTRGGELSTIYSYDAEDDRHGLDIHAHIEPLESISRVELDYDVQKKEFESTWELRVGETVCRLETRQDAFQRASLKTKHGGRGQSGSASSVGYSRHGEMKAELFKRKHAKMNASRGNCDRGTCLADGQRWGLAPSMPTVRVVHNGRLKEVGIKQWLCDDRLDVHAFMKRTNADNTEVTVGAGTHWLECDIRTVLPPSDRPDQSGSFRRPPWITLKTKGTLTSEVGYEDGKMKLSIGGKLGPDEHVKVKVKGELQSRGSFSMHAGIFICI